MLVKQCAQGLEVMIVHRLGSQRFVIVLAPVLVPRESVVGVAPFLSEDVPVDFEAFGPECGGDGRRAAGVESLMRSPLEMLGDGCAPVDDGAEDLGWVRLWCQGERSELASKSSAFGLCFWLVVLVTLGSVIVIQFRQV